MTLLPDQRMTGEGRAMLRLLEGVERMPYHDSAGLLTIGVGHLLTRDELSSGKIELGDRDVKWRIGLSDDDIDTLLEQDLRGTEEAVARAVLVDICRHQRDALISFTFNVGNRAFRRSTLLKKLNAGEREEVPAQMRRWVYAGGRKVRGLERRREAEITRWQG